MFDLLSEILGIYPNSPYPLRGDNLDEYRTQTDGMEEGIWSVQIDVSGEEGKLAISRYTGKEVVLDDAGETAFMAQPFEKDEFFELEFPLYEDSMDGSITYLCSMGKEYRNMFGPNSLTVECKVDGRKFYVTKVKGNDSLFVDACEQLGCDGSDYGGISCTYTDKDESHLKLFNPESYFKLGEETILERYTIKPRGTRFLSKTTESFEANSMGNRISLYNIKHDIAKALRREIEEYFKPIGERRIQLSVTPKAVDKQELFGEIKKLFIIDTLLFHDRGLFYEDLCRISFF